MKRIMYILLMGLFLIGVNYSQEVYAQIEIILSTDGVAQNSSLISGEFAYLFEAWGSGDEYAEYKFTITEAGYYAFCESSGNTYNWFYTNSDKKYLWDMSYESTATAHYFESGTYYLYVANNYGDEESVMVSMHKAEISIDTGTVYSTEDSVVYDKYDLLDDLEKNAVVTVKSGGKELFTATLYTCGLQCDSDVVLYNADGEIDDRYIAAGTYQLKLNYREYEVEATRIDITVSTRDLSNATTLSLANKISVEEGDLIEINVTSPTYFSWLYTPDDSYIVYPDGAVGGINPDSGLFYIAESGTIYIEVGRDMSEFAVYLADVQVVKNSEPQIKEFCKEMDSMYQLEENIMSSYSFEVIPNGGTSYIESYEDMCSLLYIDGEYANEDMLIEGNHHIKCCLHSGVILYEGYITVVSAEEKKIADLLNGGEVEIPAKAISYIKLKVDEEGKYIFLSSNDLSLEYCRYYDMEYEYRYESSLRGAEPLLEGIYYIRIDNPGVECQLSIGKLEGVKIQEQPLNDIYWLPTCTCDDAWASGKLDYEIAKMDCIVKTSIGNYTYKYGDLFLSAVECEILNSDGKVVYGPLYAGNTYRYKLYYDETEIFNETFNVNGNVHMNEIVMGDTYKITANYYTSPQYYTYTPVKNQQIEVNFKSLSWKTMNTYCYQYVDGSYQTIPYVSQTGNSDDITRIYNVQAGMQYVFTAYDLLESSHDEEFADYEWCFKLIWEENKEPQIPEDPSAPQESQIPEDPSTSQESDEIKELPKVGSKKTLSSGQYKVTKSSSKTKEVTYEKPKSSKGTSASIPSTIKINGYTYKVTEISSKAFKNNKKLKSVTIGKNVKKIGKEAFYNCKKLNKITIKSTVLQSVGKNAIKNIDKNATINVPKKQYSKYKKLFKSSTGYKKTMKIKK